MLSHLYATGFGRSATLVYGANADHLYDGELRSLARRYPGFSYHPVTVTETAAAVDSLVRGAGGLLAYVAGGAATIHRVREVLMAKGLERRAVRWEKFW
jgi:hypothetical protein